VSRFDFVIIGGGIVGLATAWQLTQLKPGLKLAVVEKESTLAFHQTGRNSGVIHSGIYYKPGSLRARNCRDGKAALEAFCDAHGVAWERTGKVIVATHEHQLAQLQAIFERGKQNGVDCTVIGIDRLQELEYAKNWEVCCRRRMRRFISTAASVRSTSELTSFD
jgi:L-2-hydroxyglutarate oxidase